MENKIAYPVVTRRELPDGYELTRDYGAKGKTVVRVLRGAADTEAGRANRALLERALEPLGYRLAGGGA